jgi:hypothetical protein
MVFGDPAALTYCAREHSQIGGQTSGVRDLSGHQTLAYVVLGVRRLSSSLDIVVAIKPVQDLRG